MFSLPRISSGGINNLVTLLSSSFVRLKKETRKIKTVQNPLKRRDRYNNVKRDYASVSWHSGKINIKG